MKIHDWGKFNIVYENNKTYLIYKIKKNQILDYDQIERLRTERYRNIFISGKFSNPDGSIRASYDITGMTALSEYLKTGLKQSEYFKIIREIQNIISFCNTSSVSNDNLICRPEYIYYHNTEKKVMMAYVPLTDPHYRCDNVPQCLLEIDKIAEKHIAIENPQSMNEYKEYLKPFKNSLKAHFSPEGLLHKLNTIEEEANRNEKHEWPPLPETPQPPVPPITDTSVYLEENISGRRYHIENNNFTIGREASSLTIPNGEISSNHAIISRLQNQYYLRDTESLNGTYLNNKRLSPQQDYPLSDGDHICFHKSEYIFHLPVKQSGATVPANRGATVPATHRVQEGSHGQTVKVADRNRALQSKQEIFCAYLKKEQDGSITGITSFPAVISNIVFLKSPYSVTNCGDTALIVADKQINKDETMEIFSGCSLCINGENYIFYEENDRG